MALPITIGTTETAFSDGEFTLDAGESKVLAITVSADGNVPATAKYEVARKSSGGKYVHLLTLSAANLLTQGRIDGGTDTTTYAVRRLATGDSTGLEVT